MRLCWLVILGLVLTSCRDGEGCPKANDPGEVDECALHVDEASCGSPCRWFESRLFRDCGGACRKADASGVCVTLESYPETGCTGPCAKFWKETPEGLQIFEADLCFEFPPTWAWCQLESRAECECGCETPP